MADDERRAEIEAVARAINPEAFEGFFSSAEGRRAALRTAERAVEHLDRVRNARGDDECRSRIPPLCDRCGGDHYITEHDAASRSPQGEDHEAGIEALDRIEGLAQRFIGVTGWDATGRDIQEQARKARAEVARVSPSPVGSVAVEDVARLIGDLIDPGPCSYDHNGLCQAHDLREKPCPHERAKDWLASTGDQAPEATS